ncbi:uncharacterized protein LOC121877442 [Homarus americanus]|nr:uncharacterized protein LOC121877442 [Homarus americanus]
MESHLINYCSSNSTSPISEDHLQSLYEGVFQVVFPTLIVVGVLTNLLNVTVLTRPMMSNKTYRWLRCLAVVDICLCVLSIPICLSNGGHGSTPYSTALYYAHFGWSSSIAAQILSFYLMSWFAYERFLAVCRHAEYRSSQRSRLFKRRVVGSVVGVVVLYLPTAVVGQVCQVDDGWIPVDGYSIVKLPLWYSVYSWVREIFSRVVPAAVITFCNVKITYRLKHLRSIRDGFGSGVSPARRERERRLVLLLFWVTAFFYVYNTPVTVYYLGFYAPPPHLRGHQQRQMMGNVSNFVLYFLINPDFQRTLKVMFHLRVPDSASAIDTGTCDVKQSSNSFRSSIPGCGTTTAADNCSDSGLQHDLPPSDALNSYHPNDNDNISL